MSTDAVPVPAPEAPQPARSKKLRIWPAILLLLLIAVAKVVQLTFMQEAAPNIPIFMSFVFGPVICCVLLGVWWLFFSRAPWSDRFLGLGGAVALTAIAYLLADKTLQGIPFVTYVFPMGVAGLTAALLVFSFGGPRVATVAALVGGALAFGYWDARRLDGVWGNFKASLSWRWEKTAEDTFLA